MSDTLILEVEKREATGKQVKAIRKEGYIPATIYQNGKESVNAKVPYQVFKKAFSQVGYAQPVQLQIDGKKRLAMVKDVHIDPAKNTIEHIAFHAIRADRVVEAEVHVRIIGDIPAEANGNFIVRQNDTIMVKGIPTDLPEYLTVSPEGLKEPGDSLTVADIDAVPNVEFVSEAELTLATVEEPRVEEEPEEAEAVDAADVPSAHGGDEAESSEEAKTEE